MLEMILSTGVPLIFKKRACHIRFISYPFLNPILIH